MSIKAGQPAIGGAAGAEELEGDLQSLWSGRGGAGSLEHGQASIDRPVSVFPGPLGQEAVVDGRGALVPHPLGEGHRYLTLLYPIDEYCRRLLWMGEERTKKSLDAGLSALEEEHRRKQEAAGQQEPTPFLDPVRAYRLKEDFQHFWEYTSPAWAGQVPPALVLPHLQRPASRFLPPTWHATGAACHP